MPCEDIRVGDGIAAYGAGTNTNTARLTGDVIKVGRVNVQIHTCVRFCPDGPWHDQVHKVPRTAIVAVMREGVFIYGSAESCKGHWG
jgi:hypothetical protein